MYHSGVVLTLPKPNKNNILINIFLLFFLLLLASLIFYSETFPQIEEYSKAKPNRISPLV